MKTTKLIPIAVGLLVAAMFSSCEKNYTCTCTTSSGGSVITTNTEELGKLKRTDAKAACESKEGSVVGVTKSCTLD